MNNLNRNTITLSPSQSLDVLYRFSCLPAPGDPETAIAHDLLALAALLDVKTLLTPADLDVWLEIGHVLPQPLPQYLEIRLSPLRWVLAAWLPEVRYDAPGRPGCPTSDELALRVGRLRYVAELTVKGILEPNDVDKQVLRELEAVGMLEKKGSSL